jgi:ubiquitin-like 1-activating enzyme E1 B
MCSLGRLAERVSANPNEPLDWDKDDDDALDFATASANLRAAVFAIPTKTRWDVKRMSDGVVLSFFIFADWIR